VSEARFAELSDRAILKSQALSCQTRVPERFAFLREDGDLVCSQMTSFHVPMWEGMTSSEGLRRIKQS